MKFITFKYDNKEQVGILTKSEQGVYPLKTLGINYETMNDLIEKITDKEIKTLQLALEKEIKEIISINDIYKMAPIPNPKQDIICLGINYMAHAVESARYKKEAFGGDRPYAVYFSKRVNIATADGDYIPSYSALVPISWSPANTSATSCSSCSKNAARSPTPKPSTTPASCCPASCRWPRSWWISTTSSNP